MNAFDVLAQLSFMQICLLIVALVAIGRGNPFTAIVALVATCFIN